MLGKTGCALLDTGLLASGSSTQQLSKVGGAGIKADGGVASGLLRTFHTVNAVDTADVREDGFQLFFVANFQTSFDTCVLPVRAAFERADVGAGIADYRGDFRQQAGTILGA